MKQNTKKALAQIQRELSVPKSKRNEFGGFNYRSAEDILKALKPLLEIHNAYILMTDEIVAVGDSLFVKAVVSFGILTDDDSGVICAHGWAKHPSALKGMTDPQMTGSASSYARKYAMAGLLMLDDNKDPDILNKQGAEKPEMTPKDRLWSAAVKRIADRKSTIESIRKSYLLSDENERLLLKEAGL